VLSDSSPDIAPTKPTIFFLFIGISRTWHERRRSGDRGQNNPRGCPQFRGDVDQVSCARLWMSGFGSSRKCRPAERKAAYGSKADFGRQLQACFEGLKNLML
jgi:hypothetical protein